MQTSTNNPSIVFGSSCEIDNPSVIIGSNALENPTPGSLCVSLTKGIWTHNSPYATTEQSSYEKQKEKLSNDLKTLTKAQRLRYKYFYDFVETLNNEAIDLWPLSDDCDKRLAIKQFIYDNVVKGADGTLFFAELKDLILDLEVVGDISCYFMLNNKICKEL